MQKKSLTYIRLMINKNGKLFSLVYKLSFKSLGKFFLTYIHLIFFNLPQYIEWLKSMKKVNFVKYAANTLLIGGGGGGLLHVVLLINRIGKWTKKVVMVSILTKNISI